MLSVRSALTFVAGVGSYRFLRIAVDDRVPSQRLVALLGHELRHAVEVARAAWVVDRASFGRLSEDIGLRRCYGTLHTCYETEAARLTGQHVLEELRQARTAATDSGLR